HEVPRPSGFTRDRKRPFFPMLHREPSKRRQMILEDILAGLSYRQISIKQRISKSTVSMHAQNLYRQHRVKGPAALRELLKARERSVSTATHAGGHASDTV